MTVAIVVGALVVLWILAHLKTSRPDGTLSKVHPYRRIMLYIMRTRNESLVFFDTVVDAENLIAYLERAKERFGGDMTHLAVAAANVGLMTSPTMNRFVAGRRLYDRNGRFLTFSMKRKQLDAKSKMATVKIEIKDGETFAELCRRINERVGEERSGKRTYADKEFDLFNALPRPIFRGAERLLAMLDYFNLIPGSFIATDPLYTSIFVANLGSLGMTPAYHHLYEYGNCPLFMMVGQVEERAVVRDGEIVIRKQLPIRFTFDERVEDGLTARLGIDNTVKILEDPARWLGCLAEDGSDARPIEPPPADAGPDEAAAS